MAIADPDLPTRFRTVSRSLALAVVLVSSLALLSRITPAVLPPLAQPLTMTPGSAWVLLLAGLSLWLRDVGASDRWRRVSAFAAAIVVSIAVIALTSDGRSTLESAPWNAAVALPVPSSVGFLALGFALLLVDWEVRDGVRPAQLLSCGVVLVALAVLFGYVYGVPLLYASDPSRPVPIQEAIVLLLAGIAVLCARPDRGLLQVVTSDTAGGILARTMPAAVLIAPAGLAWVTLRGLRLGWYDAATATALLMLELVVFFSAVIFRVARSLDASDRQRRLAEWQLRQRSLQRASVADLGQRALSDADPQSVREEAVRLLVGSLSAVWGEFLEPGPDGMLVATLGPDRGKQVSGGGTVAARALAIDRPILLHDLAGDHRIHDQRLEGHGVISAAAVAVRGAGRTHGVLGVYAERRAAFSDEDSHLLLTVANMLAAADDRRRSEEALRLSEAKFSGLFRSTPDAIALIRPGDRRLIEVNDAFLQMTELLPEDIVDQSVDRPGFWLDPPEQARELLAGAPLRNVEIRFRTKAGTPRVGLCSAEPVTVAGDAAVLAVVRDISDRKEQQDAIEEANANLGRWVDELEARSREISLLNELGELLHACMTTTEACAVATRFARELLPDASGALCLFVETAGVLETVAVWGEPGDLRPGETTFAPDACWALRRGRPHTASGEADLICAHMSSPPRLPSLCVPMVAQGEPLGILHACGSAQLATSGAQRVAEAIAEASALALANLRLRDRLRRQSIRDQLTGLFNRWYLEESLDRELARAYRSKRPLSLILMDLDDFKAVNDTFGHHAGDELLRAVGEVFRTKLRASDFACRYGGDEFLLILPETSLEDARTRAEDVRAAVRQAKIRHRGKSLGAKAISSGVVAYPDHGGSVAELLKAADTALYQAKAGGGNRVITGAPHALQ